MGLPQVLIEFKAKAETAIRRSGNGAVALILRDGTSDGTSYTYTNRAQVEKADWTAANLESILQAFEGSPRRVLVERIGTSTKEKFEPALARLRNKSWNYLAIPSIKESECADIAVWIIAQRDLYRPFKAVLPHYAGGHEAIINFCTDEIRVKDKMYTAAAYCPRIAGLLAGLPMSESATYQVLPEVDSILESAVPDQDIDAGRFILINDGVKVKVGRGVNSLTVLSGDKTEDMKKIKIIEGMDLMRTDIRSTFEDNYVGLNNSYDNKVMFLAAINQYFAALARQGALYESAENKAEIDIAAQQEWLEQKYDISDWTEDQIRQAKTGSIVFVTANVTFSDAIEDLRFRISME